jgi:hypothetical protein
VRITPIRQLLNALTTIADGCVDPAVLARETLDAYGMYAPPVTPESLHLT